jgi:hypothetical protein
MPLMPQACSLPDGRIVQGEAEEISQEVSAVVYLSGEIKNGKFCGVFVDHNDPKKVGSPFEVEVLAWKPCQIYEPVLVVNRLGFQSALNEDPSSHRPILKTMRCGAVRLDFENGNPSVIAECKEDFSPLLKEGDWERFSLCRFLTLENEVWAVLQNVEIP